MQITVSRIKTDGENYKEFSEAAVIMLNVIIGWKGCDEEEAIRILQADYPDIPLYKDLTAVPSDQSQSHE